MSFDRIAPVYRALETLVFGESLQRARTALIGQLRTSEHVLIAGEGNGRFLAELLAANDHVRVTCIDVSLKMIQLARRRIANPQQRSRVAFIHGDVLNAPLPTDCDAIVTNFFLDCFDDTELRTVVARLAGCAKENARWLVADFSIPPGAVARLRAKSLLALMYAFFRVTTRISASALIEHHQLLRDEKFQLTDRRSVLRALIVSELWQRTSGERTPPAC
jgi:ubiquinone/menaquinone biosynthesis C-methylase UbiE